MRIRPDLALGTLLEPPEDRYCISGHYAPDEELWWEVSGAALPKSRHGIYCNACIVAANKRKEELKQQGFFDNRKKRELPARLEYTIEDLIDFDPES